MDKGLTFIQSCVRRGINTDDLGYITKDYINNLDDEKAFFASIADRCESKFFDQPNTINNILQSYIASTSNIS